MQPASAIEQWQNILTKNGSIIPSATEFYRIGGKFIQCAISKAEFLFTYAQVYCLNDITITVRLIINIIYYNHVITLLHIALTYTL
jgi:hypothetical protein